MNMVAVLAIAIAFVSIFGAVYFLKRIERGVLRAVAQAGGQIDRTSGMASYQGIVYEYFYDTGKRSGSAGSPRSDRGATGVSGLILRMKLSSPGSLVVRRETKLDRFAKRAEISEEVQTGDITFDQDHYIESETPDFARTFLSAPENRQSVREILTEGYTAVELDGEFVKASWSTPPSDFRPEAVTRVLPHLAILAGSKGFAKIAGEETVAFASAPSTSSARSGGRKQSILPGGLVSIPVAAMIVGAILNARSFVPMHQLLDGESTFDPSWRYSAPAIILYAMLSLLLLRGRATAHRDLIWIAVASLLGFSSLGYGAMRLANEKLDDAAPNVYTSCVTLRGPPGSGYLLISSWRRAGDTERIFVTENEFRIARAKKTTVTVYLKPGFLSLPWIESWKVEASDRDCA